MKYNEKYDRYVTKGGLVYRYSKRQDKLILCKLTTDKGGYLTLTVSKPKITCIKVHRLVYETFKDEIPNGYDIDHINTIRNDNRLENLRIVTRSENMLNPITRKRCSEAKKGKKLSEEHKRKLIKANTGRVKSEEEKRKLSESHKGMKFTEEHKRNISKTHRGKIRSEFGRKYFVHTGLYAIDDLKSYNREKKYFEKHGKCSWE